MRAFIVHGVDDQNGASVQLSVKLGSVEEVAEFASRRGVSITAIHSESGHIYFPTEGGGFRRDDESTPATNPDTTLLVFACLVPVVGLVAGTIRLANRDRSGSRVLVLSVAWMFVWGVLLAALTKGL